MLNFYYYKHPKTGKIYSDQRMKGYESKPYIAGDGIECELLKNYSPQRKKTKSQIGIIDKNAEVFQKDAKYVRDCNPRFVKFRDGHREKYDPTKHC